MRLLDRIKRRCVVWVWNHTPSCAEMSRLSSLALDQPLSLTMRVRMWLHHRICVWCARYRRQLQFLRRAAARASEQLGVASHRGLSTEARERIVQRLRTARDE